MVEHYAYNVEVIGSIPIEFNILIMKISILNHWIVQRLTAILLIPFIIGNLVLLSSGTSLFSYDVYNLNTLFCLFTNLTDYSLFILLSILSIFWLVLMKHIYEGIDSILQDYVHNDNTRSLVLTLLIIVQIFLFKDFIFFIVSL